MALSRFREISKRAKHLNVFFFFLEWRKERFYRDCVVHESSPFAFLYDANKDTQQRAQQGGGRDFDRRPRSSLRDLRLLGSQSAEACKRKDIHIHVQKHILSYESGGRREREKERKSKGGLRNLSIFWKPYDSTKLVCVPEINVN